MNVQDMRATLIEQMGRLRTGETDAKTVNAMVNIAGCVSRTVRLEMDYAKMHGEKAQIDFMKKDNA